uniref:Uncharacterized protein n=1 Tax=Chromera velia CCMP2878 TaxID=1169474 RepID=A0A0G4GWS5_9ALVE|mmetsp:Transcript_23726/g.46613  ORF Transcript_23726/g.46613 Transcript_23726/m.46613 type:complete len:242 (+) Transcript_23726:146-871(+)|eukprot:Cvel_23708.t1-p1 / transcript=Cvel_23708.t1 / gene=Cvel_23708 / organism=Chromera_velia_CCMP2878 / gene_product=hypothetical protein / transcript_product=hypothetical protein / location=Cvel_scaffold2475:10019-11883(+) / protein_length=241 / sequence_SO=supercontig / SO=protein_coding / is_pseudo=false
MSSPSAASVRRDRIPTSAATSYQSKKVHPVVGEIYVGISKELKRCVPPDSIICYTVDYLAANYAEELNGFAEIWNGPEEMDIERLRMIHFFYSHKIGMQIVGHFCKAGFDTLDSLLNVRKDGLESIQRYNEVEWLPGHRRRLEYLFRDIAARVAAFRQTFETAPVQTALVETAAPAAEVTADPYTLPSASSNAAYLSNAQRRLQLQHLLEIKKGNAQNALTLTQANGGACIRAAQRMERMS